MRGQWMPHTRMRGDAWNAKGTMMSWRWHVFYVECSTEKPCAHEAGEHDSVQSCTMHGTGYGLWSVPCLRRAYLRDLGRLHPQCLVQAEACGSCPVCAEPSPGTWEGCKRLLRLHSVSLGEGERDHLVQGARGPLAKALRGMLCWPRPQHPTAALEPDLEPRSLYKSSTSKLHPMCAIARDSKVSKDEGGAGVSVPLVCTRDEQRLPYRVVMLRTAIDFLRVV